jgi:hypothetical protein
MGSDHYQERVGDRRAAKDADLRRKAAKAGRDGTEFIPLPYVVLESPGWRRATHVARSLLIDMAASAPNGRLRASMDYLRPRGWRSEGVVSRAVADLIACGLLIETRKGAMPNKEAWYAATWLHLKHVEGLDINPRSFKTGDYVRPDKHETLPNRARTTKATAARKRNAAARKLGYTLTPSDGATDHIPSTVRRCYGPSPAPSHGAIGPSFTPSPAPLDGANLDIHHLGGAAADRPADSAGVSAQKLIDPATGTPISPTVPALLRWVDAECDKGPFESAAIELFDHYVSFCIKHGLPRTSLGAFSRVLVNRVCGITRHRIPGPTPNGRAAFSGIRCSKATTNGATGANAHRGANV